MASEILIKNEEKKNYSNQVEKNKVFLKKWFQKKDNF